ncbi:MAG: YdbH domain-containing protein [Akkermansiaceae bacterium]|nr:YdbH domain-containing protein [Akkermansiaceae bacterium]
MIRQKIADAGLDQSELRVADVGWRSAVIEDVSVGEGMWSMQVRRLEVKYDATDLLSGTIEGIRLIDAKVVIDLSTEESHSAPEEAGQQDESVEPDAKAYWYKTVVDALNQIGEVHAEDVDVWLKRDGREWRSELDLTIDDGDKGHPTVHLETESFILHSLLQTFSESAEWKCDAKVVDTNKFIDLIELAVGYEGALLPEGISLDGATLKHTMRAQGDKVLPFEIDGLLSGVKYDGGDKPVSMTCDRELLMSLIVQPTGTGEVQFSGKLDRVSLPLDPSADFELKLKPDTLPDLAVRVVWGEQATRVEGGVKDMKLIGAYNGRAVDLDDINLDFEMVGGELIVRGGLTNEGIKVPVKYAHGIKEETGKWMMNGEIIVGPFDHDRNLPMLSAVADVFDHVAVIGSSRALVQFSTGSHKPFEGSLSAKLTDAEVSVEGGKVKASGVNGVFNLHIIPLPDDDPERKDPSYYTFDFTTKELSVASKDALDFDLHHQAETPVRISGKGNLGSSETLLTGDVKGLTLHGEKENHTLDLENTAWGFELKGDRLVASGSTVMAGNKIPFSYQHNQKEVDGGWELDGTFEIKEAELKEPVDNAVMFVDAMAGNKLGGKVSMKMDFSMGSEKDFDGVFVAAIDKGTLTMADEGPVIEGLKGDVRLESMKQKSTKGFHRVTATRIKAFDMEMKNLRLDYQLLPDGDIKLRNIVVNALGGEVWLDPFTLPGGDEDYQFKVRAKRLDIAELAKLFPDFNGAITGRIDGLLPMESVGGDIRPGKGGMYLTPRTKGRLRYDAGDRFSAGLNPKSEEYKRMKMLEDSLRNLDLEVLSIRLFDPQDQDKAIVLILRGQAHHVPGSPPIHLNINGFKPDDDTVDFFDLLLKHRDRLDFGL